MKTPLISFFDTLKTCLPALMLLMANTGFASIDITGQTCICDGDGSIELTISTDPGFETAGPFKFKWSGPNGYTSSAQSPTDLKDPGMYTVTVTDAFGCKKELSTEVENCISIELESVICYCSPDGFGMVDVTVTTDLEEPDFIYTWEGPVVSSNDAIDDEDLLAGDPGLYTLTVFDDQNGCIATFEVEVPDCYFTLTNNVEVVPDCNEEGTSSLELQLPPGMGMPPYRMTWLKIGEGIIGVEESQDGTAEVNNLGPGEYCVTVNTNNGCQEQLCELFVTETPPPSFPSEVIPVDNGSDGEITVSVTGGTGPFTFDWSGGSPNTWTVGSTTFSSISSLSSGIYSVTITYNNGGCEEVMSFNLTDCSTLEDEIDPVLAVITPMTNGEENAAIDIVNVADVYPGYNFTFEWGNNQFTEDIDGLAGGNYCVSVTLDEGDCFFQLPPCFTVCDFSIDFTVTPDGCNNSDLFVEGQSSNPAVTSYTYLWDNGSTGQTLSATNGTTYCVTVTDNSGCSASTCITPEPQPIVINADVTNSTFGNSDGEITITPEGGVPPYTYLWDDENSSTTPTISALGVDTYCVTVTDACNSTAIECFTIQCEFGQTDVTAEIVNIACSNEELGSIAITQLPDVGIPNPQFVYSWSNGGTSSTINVLEVGTYCVTITEITTGCWVAPCYEVGTDGTSPFKVILDARPSCFPLKEGEVIASQPSNQFVWAI